MSSFFSTNEIINKTEFIYARALCVNWLCCCKLRAQSYNVVWFFLIGVIYTSSILDSERQDSYWLTIYARDQGVLPLSTSIEVYVQVEDVNDNTPLTSEAIYHPYVLENSPKDVSVVRVQATDPDLTSFANHLTYRVTAGNPQNFFTINSQTGKKIEMVLIILSF